MDTSSLQSSLSALLPFAKASVSTLGRSSSVFLHISLDPEDSWAYGIFHNSRYAIFCIRDGKIELVSKGMDKRADLPKFRKSAAKDEAGVVAKVEAWVKKAQPSLTFQ